MSALHTASTVFVDFENVICDTDEFVCGKIFDAMNDDNILKDSPVHILVDVLRMTGRNTIPELVQLKNNRNVLYDLIDSSKLDISDTEDTDSQIQIVADDIYDSILYYDYKYFDDISFNNIGKSFVSLVKDDNLTKLYIFCKNVTKSIHDSIYNLYQYSDKVLIISGDKEEFLKSNKCDMYIFNDAKDIELLPPVIGKPPKNKPDILIFNNIPNQILWNDYFLDGDGTHNSVCEKYNANIAFITKN